MKKNKKNISEVALIEELLKNEGFTRITWRERRSPEFRESLKEFTKRKKSFQIRQGKSL